MAALGLLSITHFSGLQLQGSRRGEKKDVSWTTLQCSLFAIWSTSQIPTTPVSDARSSTTELVHDLLPCGGSTKLDQQHNMLLSIRVGRSSRPCVSHVRLVKHRAHRGGTSKSLRQCRYLATEVDTSGVARNTGAGSFSGTAVLCLIDGLPFLTS
jgi:hypothetical protein